MAISLTHGYMGNGGFTFGRYEYKENGLGITSKFVPWNHDLQMKAEGEFEEVLNKIGIEMPDNLDIHSDTEKDLEIALAKKDHDINNRKG